MREEAKKREIDAQWPIAIVGSGPVGLLAAVMLAPLYEQVCLIGSREECEDERTSALMMPAIRQLEELDLWQQLQSESAPLKTLRIMDATSRLLRASPLTFHASEIGEEAFGYNIPNKVLNKALTDKVNATPNIIWHPHKVSHYQHQARGVTIELDDGTHHEAALIIAADGRHSPARTAAGIKARQWHYPQTALVLNFAHQLPHNNTSHEFHTAQGPFTQVPLPGNRSSLVWVVKPEQAKCLLGLSAKTLAEEIESQMGSMLGKVEIDGENWHPQAWPLGGIILSQFAAKRTIVIGEAAHVFPPIGAQGLNLGLRDVGDLVQILVQAGKGGEHGNIIRGYNRRRRPDIWARTGLVHALNRTLLADFLPIQLIRYCGLEALRCLPPLRGWLMREGLSPGSGFGETKTALRHLMPRPSFSSTN